MRYSKHIRQNSNSYFKEHLNDTGHMLNLNHGPKKIHVEEKGAYILHWESRLDFPDKIPFKPWFFENKKIDIFALTSQLVD